MIGGAAGCFPVLVGWAAVKGTVAVPAIVLFAVIFLWTPPHFWALAMKFKDDYARGRTSRCSRWWPRPPRSPARSSCYSYAMVAATLALAPYAGWIYTAPARSASAAGSSWRRTACTPGVRSADGRGKPFPMRLFHLSIAYLTLLFVAVAVTALLPLGRW